MSRLPSRPLRHSTLCRYLVSLTVFLAPFFISAQKVGINTDAPVAGLHILSNDGFLAVGEHGLGFNPPSGYGSRMLWFPKTSAFRFGRITDADGGIYQTWWDFSNTGDYSFAGGVNTKASAFASFSMGGQNAATGSYSFIAGGLNNEVAGNHGFAAGTSVSALSFSEFAIGTFPTLYTPVSTTGFENTDRVFAVGNGQSSSERRNALTILKNGNIGMNIDVPQYTLHVSGPLAIQANRLVFSGTGGSVFIGDGAGSGDDMISNNNVYIGTLSGQHNQSGQNNIGIGSDALQQSNTTSDNIAIGRRAMLPVTSGDFNVAIGSHSMSSSTGGNHNVAIGGFTLNTNTTGEQNVAIGTSALHNSTSAQSNVAIGSNALFLVSTGSRNVSIGQSTLQTSFTSTQNVAVGHEAGSFNFGNSNVFLGYQAGKNAAGSNLLYIENSDTSTPLIYGEFDKNKVVINDSLQTTYFRMTNGAGLNRLMQSDGSGNAVWVDPAALFSDDWNANGTSIYNNNAGNVGIGTNTPQDKLHLMGTMRIDGGRLSFDNTGGSVFIGHGAGASDDLSNNTNVFIGEDAGAQVISGNNSIAIGKFALTTNVSSTQNIALGVSALHFNTASGNIGMGFRALYANSTGPSNLAIGNHALFNNTTGTQNVALGERALFTGASGSGNVAIGYQAGLVTTGQDNTFLGHEAGYSNNGSRNVFLGNDAGYDETGNDKLYIDNSSTSSPLIYGDFEKNKVIINDSLQAGYFRMTNGAGSGKLLQSSDNGQASWVDPSSVFTSTWTLSGNDQFNSNSGNIGIGTNAPLSKLHIVGDVMLDGGKLKTANTGGSVIIGEGAGENDDLDENYNTFIGYEAGYGTTNGSTNIALGLNAFYANQTGNRNIAIGKSALFSNTTGSGNLAIGSFSMHFHESGFGNIAIGDHALEFNTAGNANLAIGFMTGNNVTGTENTLIGHEAGFTTTGSGNVFLGTKAGYFETGSNKLYIDNTDTATPLIYGDLQNNKVVVNDSLQSRYFRMTQNPVDGHVLKSDANGNAKWVNPSTLLNGMWALNTVNEIYNTNSSNVGIGTVNPNSTLHVVGNVLFENARLSLVNAGNSVFIGENAGAVDDLSDNRSVFIGYNAGMANTTGTNNIAIGAYAIDEATNSNYNIAIGDGVLGQTGMSGNYNTGIGNFSLAGITSGGDNLAMGQNAGGNVNSGFRNIAIGNYAMDALADGASNTVIGYEALGESISGNNNTVIGHFAGSAIQGSNNVILGHQAGLTATGSGNVFLGTEAGSAEGGDNKLYIDNSATASPLIHGDFAANEVTINDSLTVGRELGIATSTPNSTLEVNGSVGAAFKSGLVAGTTHPDATGMVWRYSSGTGSIDLPGASTCPNRVYVIINQTGSTRTISTYRDLVTNNQTTIASSVALWLMSDGSQWWQVK